MIYKTYYICHHCVNYITSNKNDLARHFKIKEKCKHKYKYNYEESEEISTSRKYYIKKDEIIKKDNLLSYIEIYEKDESIKQDEIIKSNNNIINKYFYNHEKKVYCCTDCFGEFVSKQNFEIHLMNKDKCDKAYFLHQELNKMKLKIEDEEKKNKVEYILNKCNEKNISFEKIEEFFNLYENK